MLLTCFKYNPNKTVRCCISFTSLTLSSLHLLRSSLSLLCYSTAPLSLSILASTVCRSPISLPFSANSSSLSPPSPLLLPPTLPTTLRLRSEEPPTLLRARARLPLIILTFSLLLQWLITHSHTLPMGPVHNTAMSSTHGPVYFISLTAQSCKEVDTFFCHDRYLL